MYYCVIPPAPHVNSTLLVESGFRESPTRFSGESITIDSGEINGQIFPIKLGVVFVGQIEAEKDVFNLYFQHTSSLVTQVLAGCFYEILMS